MQRIVELGIAGQPPLLAACTVRLLASGQYQVRVEAKFNPLQLLVGIEPTDTADTSAPCVALLTILRGADDCTDTVN